MNCTAGCEHISRAIPTHLEAHHLQHQPTGDVVDRDSPTIFYLFQMVAQAGTKIPGLTYIDRQTAAKKNVYTRLTRSFGLRQGVFRTGLQCGDQLVLMGLIDIALESVAVAHEGT